MIVILLRKGKSLSDDYHDVISIKVTDRHLNFEYKRESGGVVEAWYNLDELVFFKSIEL